MCDEEGDDIDPFADDDEDDDVYGVSASVEGEDIYDTTSGADWYGDGDVYDEGGEEDDDIVDIETSEAGVSSKIVEAEESPLLRAFRDRYKDEKLRFFETIFRCFSDRLSMVFTETVTEKSAREFDEQKKDKRARNNTGGDDHQVYIMWQVHLDRGWTNFPDVESIAIENGKKRTTGEFELQNRHGKYCIDYQGMTQTNVQSRKKRRIRRRVASISEEVQAKIVQVMDFTGCWYGSARTILLDMCGGDVQAACTMALSLSRDQKHVPPEAAPVRQMTPGELNAEIFATNRDAYFSKCDDAYEKWGRVAIARDFLQKKQAGVVWVHIFQGDLLRGDYLEFFLVEVHRLCTDGESALTDPQKQFLKTLRREPDSFAWLWHKLYPQFCDKGNAIRKDRFESFVRDISKRRTSTVDAFDVVDVQCDADDFEPARVLNALVDFSVVQFPYMEGSEGIFLFGGRKNNTVKSLRSLYAIVPVEHDVPRIFVQPCNNDSISRCAHASAFCVIGGDGRGGEKKGMLVVCGGRHDGGKFHDAASFCSKYTIDDISNGYDEGTWSIAKCGNKDSSPPPREGHSLVFTSGVFVCIGGIRPTGQNLSDVWVLRGTSWTQLTPSRVSRDLPVIGPNSSVVVSPDGNIAVAPKRSGTVFVARIDLDTSTFSWDIVVATPAIPVLSFSARRQCHIELSSAHVEPEHVMLSFEQIRRDGGNDICLRSTSTGSCHHFECPASMTITNHSALSPIALMHPKMNRNVRSVLLLGSSDKKSTSSTTGTIPALVIRSESAVDQPFVVRYEDDALDRSAAFSSFNSRVGTDVTLLLPRRIALYARDADVVAPLHASSDVMCRIWPTWERDIEDSGKRKRLVLDLSKSGVHYEAAAELLCTAHRTATKRTRRVTGLRDSFLSTCKEVVGDDRVCAILKDTWELSRRDDWPGYPHVVEELEPLYLRSFQAEVLCCRTMLEALRVRADKWICEIRDDVLTSIVAQASGTPVSSVICTLRAGDRVALVAACWQGSRGQKNSSTALDALRRVASETFGRFRDVRGYVLRSDAAFAKRTMLKKHSTASSDLNLGPRLAYASSSKDVLSAIFLAEASRVAGESSRSCDCSGLLLLASFGHGRDVVLKAWGIFLAALGGSYSKMSVLIDMIVLQALVCESAARDNAEDDSWDMLFPSVSSESSGKDSAESKMRTFVYVCAVEKLLRLDILFPRGTVLRNIAANVYTRAKLNSVVRVAGLLHATARGAYEGVDIVDVAASICSQLYAYVTSPQHGDGSRGDSSYFDAHRECGRVWTTSALSFLWHYLAEKPSRETAPGWWVRLFRRLQSTWLLPVAHESDHAKKTPLASIVGTYKLTIRLRKGSCNASVVCDGVSGSVLECAFPLRFPDAGNDTADLQRRVMKALRAIPTRMSGVVWMAPLPP